MAGLSPDELRRRCARSPLEFGRHFLSHYFTCRPPAFHRELCRQWQVLVMKRKNPIRAESLEKMRTAKGRRLVIAAPRGHGKSTVMSLQNVLHAALYGYKTYILLVSDTEAQAVSFLDAIKAELEDNELLQAAFGAKRQARYMVMIFQSPSSDFRWAALPFLWQAERSKRRIRR